MTQKKILIIAGPNGAGKSTFAREYLPNEADCPLFVNADLIAAGLSPFRPELASLRAGRIMLGEISEHVRKAENFAFETTLSGRGYVRLIRDCRKRGYQVKLIFLSLQAPDEAINRVAARVSQGGHHIADDVVIRRFYSGLANFRDIYQFEVDKWLLYDNSGSIPLLVEEGINS